MCIRDRYNDGRPFERIALDIAGPFPVTDDGNRYIMVLGDYLTTVSYTHLNETVVTIVGCCASSTLVTLLIYKYCNLGYLSTINI